ARYSGLEGESAICQDRKVVCAAILQNHPGPQKAEYGPADRMCTSAGGGARPRAGARPGTGTRTGAAATARTGKRAARPTVGGVAGSYTQCYRDQEREIRRFQDEFHDGCLLLRGSAVNALHPFAHTSPHTYPPKWTLTFIIWSNEG